ncbi:hypothetical protein CHLRE_17g702500v5 [Chlamydomonas reinhardtii]|uniref:Tab2 protein n=1 Tax=Chlamydomonas reinhardtii TaxID=3055 RepID=Q7X8Y6_CHLRE|nr:uncharacterized protein CHLRE_17g702500v5 [Chlamydomonas reinhardtii]PNW70022.1 hypothetical protein CHLRE_17g702500v5 [Chlamydomonas reinhardtii]CAE17328.1 Tab2 protein [Chlamydomonas reinhardtii]CAE17329.1 Tab2 protein [Chlamydomonas reinhardtii]|eukprot:XP_001691593.1 PsaB RNA binding protein [Chlamydomonas reinhardtii]
MSLLLGNQGLGHAGRPSTSANVKLQPRLRAIRARVQQTGRRVEHRVVFAQAAHDTAVTQPSTSSAAKGLPKSSVWEIDFCSRPLLDERGKKVWELLICDPERNFEYSEYFPNSKINSAELKRTIERILAQAGAERPEKARFFRSQMQTIITKALTDCQIKAVPSRRCFTVMSWINERLESVYKQDPRFSDKAQSLFQLDLGPPEALPDALRGEQWAFVQLPLGTLLQMLKRVDDAEIFGSGFTLGTVGLADLPADILIPGVVVFSRRALPLAAWTNGLEIAAVKADVARSCLILETGVNQRWKYGSWRPNEDSIGEAEGWEIAKQGVKGVHFLAVQPDPDSEELNGLWLLQDCEPPTI